MKILKAPIAIACAAILVCLPSARAVLINAPGQTVLTNFDSWGGTLPASFSINGPSNATTYRGESASLNTGGTYNVSGFDFQASSTANSLSLTGIWQNNTGLTLNSLTISYDAYVVFPRESRVPSWDVTSNLGFDLGGLTWTAGEGDRTLSVTIDNLSIAPGESFDLTWATGRGEGSGSTPKVGMDNIRVTASAVPEPGTVALLGFGAIAAVAALRRRRVG